MAEGMMASFPSSMSPRPIQDELVQGIEERIKSGYKKIILSAPTGAGKSIIAVCAARHARSSLIVTASKHLQDQYAAEFPDLKPVKGKSNFACLQIMERKKADMSDLDAAVRAGMTCEKGRCQEKSGGMTRTCSYKPDIQDYESGRIPDEPCHYYAQKFEALASPHSLWNYHAYFQAMRYNLRSYGKYMERGVAIFDEAHRIEDQILQFVGVRIGRNQAEECGIKPGAYNLGRIDDIIGMLGDMAGYYSRQMSDLQQSRAFEQNPDYDRLARLDSSYIKFAGAAAEISSNTPNFVINSPGGAALAEISPLDVSGYVQKLFQAPLQIFMSATINRDSFCETTGVPASEVGIVEAPRSPFPAESRRVEFLDVRSLNYRSSDADERAVISSIDEIMSRHAGERGLILSSSKSRCFGILDGLSEKNRHRIRVCHSGGSVPPEKIIEEHASDPTGVLLSSSLWEGVDLKNDLSRFQIIAKAPYPNFSDKRVAAKSKKYPLWYNAQTLTKLLQGMGRSVRGADDWAVTYILDAAVRRLLERCHTMVPASYRDVLG